MTDHIGVERMHDVLDGLLEPDEEEAVRAHLESCAECAGELDRLARTVEAIRALPRAARPPVGAWAGVEARIRGTRPGGADEATVLAFPGAARRWRLSLSAPQLAAAAVLVALLSGLAVWFALGGYALDPATPMAGAPPAGGAAARAAATGDAGYDAAIGELETLVAQGRSVLAPETLAQLNAAIATIDAALAEVREALAADPGSALLQSLLVDRQTAKMRVLRQAATAIQMQS